MRDPCSASVSASVPPEKSAVVTACFETPIGAFAHVNFVPFARFVCFPVSMPTRSSFATPLPGVAVVYSTWNRRPFGSVP